MGVNWRSYEIGPVRMDVVADPDGQSVIRLLDMDSALVVELRGCQRSRLRNEFEAWRSERGVDAVPAGEFFELAGRLQGEGCVCDASRCGARGRPLRLCSRA